MPVKAVRRMTPRKLGNYILVQPDDFRMAFLGSSNYLTSHCSRLCGDCQHRVPVNEWCACELGLLRDVGTCLCYTVSYARQGRTNGRYAINGKIRNTLLINPGFHTRRNFSESYPNYGRSTLQFSPAMP